MYDSQDLPIHKGVEIVRKYGKILIIFVLIYLILYACSGPSKAADVWVDHRASENVDLYVIEDTLASGREAYGPWVSVDVKRVQNGSLENVVTWRFFKAESVWQYATNTMASGRRAGVLAPDRIFEYGMKQLDWSYSSDGMHYY